MSEDFIGQIRQKRCFGRRKEEKMKTISLLGSTGSIGTQTLDVIRRNKDIKVAVMGCAVNGPGEAKEADIGIAGGNGNGLIFKKGQIVKKVKEDKLLDELMAEIEKM